MFRPKKIPSQCPFFPSRLLASTPNPMGAYSDQSAANNPTGSKITSKEKEATISRGITYLTELQHMLLSTDDHHLEVDINNAMKALLSRKKEIDHKTIVRASFLNDDDVIAGFYYLAPDKFTDVMIKEMPNSTQKMIEKIKKLPDESPENTPTRAYYP